MRKAIFALGVAIALAFAACDPSLPDGESAEAKVYANRCSGCHRLYDPSVMKFAMWEVVVGRMEGLMARSGRAPLAADERRQILDYLERHALD